MKRIGNLWPQVTSFENVLCAALAAASGKKARPDVARFLLNLETEVASLRRELLDGSYQPGPYTTFTVREPKKRLISAAAFRDRVAHHALTRVLEPVFEPRFSPCSWACRKGKGAHLAVEYAGDAAREYPWVLKCDIKKYFASIDHQILNDLLARKVKCPQTLHLAGRIIDGSNPQEDTAFYFPGDDLFTPFQRRRGLPLGNQTSQFFANLYLDPLDQYITRELRAPAYARYVDDFLLFGSSREELKDTLVLIRAKLDTLRLLLHPHKSRVHPVRRGVTFLGWRIFPSHRRLASANVARFQRRMRQLTGLLEARPAIMGWVGHASAYRPASMSGSS